MSDEVRKLTSTGARKILLLSSGSDWRRAETATSDVDFIQDACR